eukprot:m.550076 g.550076  ORF g.550076 m.550076 type:complete len:473 (+) comp22161_c0_seq1:247-1665(+)
MNGEAKPSTAEVDVEGLTTPSPALTLFEKVYRKYKPSVEHPSLKVIPRFFKDVRPKNELARKFRNLARELHYRRLAQQEVTDDELKVLWGILDGCSGSSAEKSSDPVISNPDDDGSAASGMSVRGRTAPDTQAWVTYEQLMECAALVRQKCSKFVSFFHPFVILRLHHNERGHIAVNQLFDLVMRQVGIWQQRLEFCTYDGDGNGYLGVSEVQEFVLDRIQALPQLAKLDEAFYETYAVYAASKFFFFLDRNRTRTIRIKDMLLSDVLNEFNELAVEEPLPREHEETNWFSLPFVSRVHGTFLALDKDHNGLLSQEELQQYEYTTVPVVERLFQISPLYHGCIDYRTFLAFVLARENLQTPEAIAYFARLLDIDGKGGISHLDIAHFWGGVLDHPLMSAVPPLVPFVEATSADNIAAEIFDMVCPKHPDLITVKELVSCGLGHTICGLLTDFDAFYFHETNFHVDRDRAELV